MVSRRRQTQAELVASAQVITFDRQFFLREVWDYQPGEHVTVLAPSGGGKTHLAYQLLGETAHPELQACVIVMKPRDETVDKWNRRLKFKVVRDWPPTKIAGMITKRPSGYVLWPKESEDPDETDARHYRIFRRAILDLYYHAVSKKSLTKSVGKITFADEVVSLEDELGLRPELQRVWSKGRSMSDGLWGASQRPAYISRFAYQAHHLFLGNDPDEDVQKRYGEIGGGIDKELVRALCANLKDKQFVYIHRDSKSICIVDR
jgi:hypothetical protein